MEEKNKIEKEKVEILKEVKSQFDIIINLLALYAGKTLNAEEVKDTITKGRADQKKVIQIFNSCDGKKNLAEIANKYKIDTGNFSRDVDSWVRRGYVIKIDRQGKVFPKALIYL